MNQRRNKTKSGLSRRTFIRGATTAIAKAMKCPNAPEADRFLKESYRAGWELPT